MNTSTTVPPRGKKWNVRIPREVAGCGRKIHLFVDCLQRRLRENDGWGGAKALDSRLRGNDGVRGAKALDSRLRGNDGVRDAKALDSRLRGNDGVRGAKALDSRLRGNDGVRDAKALDSRLRGNDGWGSANGNVFYNTAVRKTSPQGHTRRKLSHSIRIIGCVVHQPQPRSKS